VLVCLIERLLPPDYFAPSLLASRADQLVLTELVAQVLPKVDKHLGELGVDLAAVTFGWWLSLFCDCLPVEVCLWVSRAVFVFGWMEAGWTGRGADMLQTLFRVWDVFCVEGHDVSFGMVWT
jgi:hypothetical protein